MSPTDELSTLILHFIYICSAAGAVIVAVGLLYGLGYVLRDLWLLLWEPWLVLWRGWVEEGKKVQRR